MTHQVDLSELTKEQVIDSLNEIRHPVEVAVFGLKNTFNFGGIVRVSHNFLVKNIWAINIENFYKKGAMTTLKWEKKNIHKVSLEKFIELNNHKNLVAFEKRQDLNTEDIRLASYRKNSVFIFGSEDAGVPQELLGLCDKIVSIPVYGLCLDYNVACAASIALYDWTTKYYRGEVR